MVELLVSVAEKLRKLGHTMDEENKFVQVKGLQAAGSPAVRQRPKFDTRSSSNFSVGICNNKKTFRKRVNPPGWQCYRIHTIALFLYLSHRHTHACTIQAIKNTPRWSHHPNCTAHYGRQGQVRARGGAFEGRPENFPFNVSRTFT